MDRSMCNRPKKQAAPLLFHCHTMNSKILLIEDEPGLIVTLSDRLRNLGYGVESAPDGMKGLEKARGSRYDLIILDVMLPKQTGLDVCRQLRTDGNPTPILMLTAKGQVTDKVIGLKLGADDYLTKPFDMSELTARVEALLRRTESVRSGDFSTERIFIFGNISVDFRKAEIKKSGTPVELSAQEFRLLQYMIEHRGDTLSREELLEKVWNYEDEISTRTVDVHIAGLRQKLEVQPKRPHYFITVHKLGYKFTHN